MTIHTNVATGDTAGLRSGPGAVSFASMFGLGLLGLAFGRRKSLRRRIPALLALLLCCATLSGVSALSGCSSQQLGVNSSTVTPSGTSYMVSVTAKQVGSQVITANPYIVYGNGNQMSLPFTVGLTVQ